MARTVLDEFITIFRFTPAGAGAVKADLASIDQQINKTATAIGRSSIMWTAAFGFLSKHMADAESQIVSMATQARVGVDEMWEMDKALRAAGKSAGVTGAQMRDAAQEIIERTGKINLALNNADLLAQMIRGGRLDPRDAGNFLAGLNDIGIPDDEYRKVINMSTHVAKLGSIPIDKLANVLPRALGMSMAAGVGDPSEAAVEAVAMLEVINRITRSEKKAVTAFENMIQDYSQKIGKLNQLTGAQLTGNEGPLRVMQEIVRYYNQTKDQQFLEGFFGKDTLEGAERTANVLSKLGGSMFGRRGVRGIAAGILAPEGMSPEDLIRQAKEAGDTVAQDTETWAGTIDNAIKGLITVFEEFTNKVIESGGLVSAITALNSVLEVLAAIISVVPNWFMSAFLASLMLRKVLFGLAVKGFQPLIMRLIFASRWLKSYYLHTLLAARGNLMAAVTWKTLGKAIWTALGPLKLFLIAIEAIFWIVSLLIPMFNGMASDKKIDVAINNADLSNIGLQNIAPATGQGFAGKQVITNVRFDSINSNDAEFVKEQAAEGVRTATQQSYDNAFFQSETFEDING